MPSVIAKPTLERVLSALSRERLYDLARVMGAGLQETKAPKAELVTALSSVLDNARLPAVLRKLGRDELRAVHPARESAGVAVHNLRQELRPLHDLLEELSRPEYSGQWWLIDVTTVQ